MIFENSTDGISRESVPRSVGPECSAWGVIFAQSVCCTDPIGSITRLMNHSYRISGESRSVTGDIHVLCEMFFLCIKGEKTVLPRSDPQLISFRFANRDDLIQLRIICVNPA